MASPTPLPQDSGEMAELELQSQAPEAFSDPEKRGIQQTSCFNQGNGERSRKPAKCWGPQRTPGAREPRDQARRDRRDQARRDRRGFQRPRKTSQGGPAK